MRWSCAARIRIWFSWPTCASAWRAAPAPSSISEIYAKAFFDLQLQFADKVAMLSGRPLAHMLFEYTNLYIRFGLGRDFDPAHPTWQEFLAGLKVARDIREWTYGFYMARPAGGDGPTVQASIGCFAYARLDAGRIRLHFRNAEPNERSPLAAERVGQRMAELAALFEDVNRTARQPLRVVGTSWLYNLEAYRRLFPPSYVVTARVSGPRFQHMPLWGQFLDRHGAVKEHVARPFLERLGRQSSLDNLDRCFPLQALSVEAPVQDFYDFYSGSRQTRPCGGSSVSVNCGSAIVSPRS
jgi:hypothetical protein